MAKFAVYYVPPAEDEFYCRATEILGYDVRAGKSVQMSAALQRRFDCIGGFVEGWVKDARPYGFHVTVGDAIDFSLGDILAIENEVEDILNCFSPDNPFELRRRADDFVTFWPTRNGDAVVLRYDPNDHLKILHALVTARVHPLGVGSGYLERYIKNPTQYADRPYRAHRVRKFFSPTVLDSYSPHFTVMNPYNGESKNMLTRLFDEMFGEFAEITVESLCLLLKTGEDDNWQVWREFKRESYPKTTHPASG